MAGLLLSVPLLFAGCATIQNPLAGPVPEMAPLESYSDGHDSYTTATAEGKAEAKAAGYHLVRVEGFVFKNPQTNTVPLKQFLSVKRHDYALLGGSEPKFFKRGGYKFVRIEGYAYVQSQPDTVALKRFKQGTRDDLATATVEGEKEARATGYAFQRIEAYVPATSNVVLQWIPAKTAYATPETQPPIVLKNNARFTTTNTFQPPVEITIVAKTDSTNLRIGYAADQIIFNWEMNPGQLRVDGGPANGWHKAGAGSLPVGKFVTLRWRVTATNQTVFVDGQPRFEHIGDYSQLNRPVSVFPAEGSTVTVKSLTVKPLVATYFLKTKTPPPAKEEKTAARQIQKWITQLADPDFSKREAAVGLLAENSATATPALQTALKKTPDEERRWWIQSALQACGN